MGEKFFLTDPITGNRDQQVWLKTPMGGRLSAIDEADNGEGESRSRIPLHIIPRVAEDHRSRKIHSPNNDTFRPNENSR